MKVGARSVVALAGARHPPPPLCPACATPGEAPRAAPGAGIRPGPRSCARCTQSLTAANDRWATHSAPPCFAHSPRSRCGSLHGEPIMSDTKHPDSRLEPCFCPRRTSLLRFLEAEEIDPLPTTTASTVARLLGAYTELESAARAAHRTAALPAPVGFELHSPGASQHGAPRASRPPEMPGHARAARAARARRRDRRLEPARGVHSLRGRAPLRYLTRPLNRFE